MALSLKVAARMIEDGELDKRRWPDATLAGTVSWGGSRSQRADDRAILPSMPLKYQLGRHPSGASRINWEPGQPLSGLTVIMRAAPGCWRRNTLLAPRQPCGARLMRGSSAYIGIDLGIAGRLSHPASMSRQGIAYRKTHRLRPHPLWSEQDPEQWWL